MASLRKPAVVVKLREGSRPAPVENFKELDILGYHTFNLRRLRPLAAAPLLRFPCRCLLIVLRSERCPRHFHATPLGLARPQLFGRWIGVLRVTLPPSLGGCLSMMARLPLQRRPRGDP